MQGCKGKFVKRGSRKNKTYYNGVSLWLNKGYFYIEHYYRKILLYLLKIKFEWQSKNLFLKKSTLIMRPNVDY